MLTLERFEHELFKLRKEPNRTGPRTTRNLPGQGRCIVAEIIHRIWPSAGEIAIFSTWCRAIKVPKIYWAARRNDAGWGWHRLIDAYERQYMRKPLPTPEVENVPPQEQASELAPV